MSAFDRIKEMTPGEILEQLTAAEIETYGIDREGLVENWKTASRIGREENHPMKIIAGLNNSDIAGILLEVLKNNVEKVMEGMQIAAYVMDADEMILYLPEDKEGLNEIIGRAESAGIKIKTGIINCRDYRGCIINHIVTMMDVADCLAGVYQGGIYVSVNNNALQRVLSDTKVKDLIGDKTVKALEMGHCFFGAEGVNLSVGEAQIWNGVLRVYTESDCLVKETQNILLAYRKQSCGRCVFCREGLLQLHSMVKEMEGGKGKQEYLEIMIEIAQAMSFSTLCSLGQKSVQTILSGLKYFRDEYEEHMKKKICAAGRCFSSVIFYIDPKTCEGCGTCMDVCPVDCIEGKAGYIHRIDTMDCIACGTCYKACKAGSIHKTADKLPKLPNRFIKCGKFKRHS